MTHDKKKPCSEGLQNLFAQIIVDKYLEDLMAIPRPKKQNSVLDKNLAIQIDKVDPAPKDCIFPRLKLVE